MRSLLTRARAGFGSATVALLLGCPFRALAEDDVGFPQFEQVSSFAGQIFWLAICFVLLYLLMSQVALPQVDEVVEARRKNRQEDLKAADKAQREAQKIKTIHEASLAKAQNAALEVTHAVEREISAYVAREKGKLAEEMRRRLGETEAAIARARQNASAALVDIAADLAAEMSAKIAGVEVGKAEAKAAVAGLKKE